MRKMRSLEVKIPVLVVAPMLLFLVVVGYALWHMRSQTIEDAKRHAMETTEVLHRMILVAMKIGGGKEYDALLTSLRGTLGEIQDLSVIAGEEVIRQFGTKVTRSPNESEEAALRTGRELLQIRDDNGEKVMKRVIPIRATEECLGCHKTSRDAVLGALSLSMSLSLLETRGIAFANRLLLLSALVVVIIGSIAFTGLRMSVIRPLTRLTGAFEKRKEGDLTIRVPRDRNDEIGILFSSFNEMGERLNVLMKRVRDAAVSLSSAAQEIVAVSQQQESGAAQQAAAVNETTSTMEELAQTSRQIAENAVQVARIAEENVGAAAEGQGAVHQVAEGIRQVQGNVRAMAEGIVTLSRKVQQIGHIVEIIDEIADKSDLLALNAALEGSKAGEVGKGFSLVAAEMRRLAESVVGSTKEIRRLIEEIQEATQRVVMTTETGVKAAEQGVGVAGEATAAFQRIVERVKETTEAAKQISLATQQQKSGTDQVVGSMTEMVEVSRQGAAGSKQVTQAAMELTALATELKGLIGAFQIDDGDRKGTG